MMLPKRERYIKLTYFDSDGVEISMKLQADITLHDLSDEFDGFCRAVGYNVPYGSGEDNE